MSSPPSPRDLDGLIEEEWGAGALDRPDVMALLEPFRSHVDYLMDDFDDETQSWRDYCGCIWGYGRKAFDMEGAIPYAVQDAVVELLKQPAPAPVVVVNEVVTARSMVDELCAALDAAGATLTFDSRRIARAAHGWPDRLPPMFGEASLAVERWGKHAQWDMWTEKRPDEWPAPTVVVGQTFEQKSSLIPTWEAAERAPYPYGIVRHTVMRVDGERFLNERGYHVPWADIPGPHYRIVSPFVHGVWSCDAPIKSGHDGRPLHARRFTSAMTGLVAAEAWRAVEVKDQWDAEWTWHTWDVRGTGGENASSPSYEQMVIDVRDALDRQAKRAPSQWHMMPVEPDDEDEDE